MSEAVRILLVEDDEGDAELALRALAKAGTGAGVRHVADGEQALDFLFGRGRFEGKPGAGSVRLVLLDLKLPKLGGREVLTALRAHPSTRTLPVVVLTSSMLPADVRDCYRAGANSFVVKPVEFSRHERTLRQLAEYWTGLNVTPPSPGSPAVD
jgi:two-component system, response regulator